jgi:hypothetical protein
MNTQPSHKCLKSKRANDLLVIVANATVPGGEHFYDVPVDDIEIVNLMAKS